MEKSQEYLVWTIADLGVSTKVVHMLYLDFVH